MGRLVRTTTGEECLLETEHVVGRSERAALRLDSAFVSSQHASLRWLGDGWELKDLGSRNGTAVDGTPVAPGQAVRLRAGMSISFGRAEQTKPHERSILWASAAEVKGSLRQPDEASHTPCKGGHDPPQR